MSHVFNELEVSDSVHWGVCRTYSMSWQCLIEFTKVMTHFILFPVLEVSVTQSDSIH